MGRLSDLFKQDTSALRDAWKKTVAAGEHDVLPHGEYVAKAVSGELFESNNKTPGYRLTFEITGGEHAGRRIWHELYLTASALPITLRDLRKFGIAELEDLEKPLPLGFVCKIKLTIRRSDNGNEFNRVQRLEVTGREEPKSDPFAPPAGNMPF